MTMLHLKLIIAIVFLTGCASSPNVYIPESSAYYSEDDDPLGAVSRQEWNELVIGFSSKTIIGKYNGLTSTARALMDKGSLLISRGQRNVGLRWGLKGLVMAYSANDFDQASPEIFSLESNEASLSNTKASYKNLGLTDSDFSESLRNLASAAALTSLVNIYSEEKRISDLTPKEKKPHINSRTALNRYLKKVVDGGESLSTFWCEKTKQFSTSLFSPRSYKIYGDRNQKDSYAEVFGAYYESYKVLIESSNKGGSPIALTWTISLLYSERVHRPGKVDWCIQLVRE